MALMLAEEGFTVKEIFATVGELNFRFLKRLAEISPDTKVYSNLSPTMMHYTNEFTEPAESDQKNNSEFDSDNNQPDICIGSDAMYYHPGIPGVEWCDEQQPFGYDGVIKLFEEFDKALGK